MVELNDIRVASIQSMVEATTKTKHPMTYIEAQTALFPDTRNKITNLRLLDIVKKIAGL